MEGGLEDQVGKICQKTQENYKLIKITRKKDSEEDPENLKCNNRNSKETRRTFSQFEDIFEAAD